MEMMRSVLDEINPPTPLVRGAFVGALLSRLWHDRYC